MTLIDQLKHRILILDGAMGTMIESFNLDEATFRGSRWVNHPMPLSSNYDALNITAPYIISDIHQAYIDAGADIICTNTFSSNPQAQSRFGLEDDFAELNHAGARIARKVADRCINRKVWVAGTMGPTAIALTHTDDKELYNKLSHDFEQQATALVDGGVDILLLETCYDPLTTRAALDAIMRFNIPTMVSITINGDGTTPLGVTALDFYESIKDYPILSFGFNCSEGIESMQEPLITIVHTLNTYISLHPNAGITHTTIPQAMASTMAQCAHNGLINIAGGCCGTTPSHIKTIAQALDRIKPRIIE